MALQTSGTTPPSLVLFGGNTGWNAADWTASDDRVRGGGSQSYLSISDSSARFYGVLDVKTLGGAGFASQRTTGGHRIWDLSGYDGMVLSIESGDSKQYTFVLKDDLLPPDPQNGRQRSTISYEYEFSISSVNSPTPQDILTPWNKFKATYRGKEKQDAPALNVREIRRMSLMMRSFFGSQEGSFSLTLGSIGAYRDQPPC